MGWMGDSDWQVVWWSLVMVPAMESHFVTDHSLDVWDFENIFFPPTGLPPAIFTS